jgi:hypothetical protein
MGFEASLSSATSTSTPESITICPDFQGISHAPEGKHLLVQKWLKRETDLSPGLKPNMNVGSVFGGQVITSQYLRDKNI